MNIDTSESDVFFTKHGLNSIDALVKFTNRIHDRIANKFDFLVGTIETRRISSSTILVYISTISTEIGTSRELSLFPLTIKHSRQR